MIPVNRPGYWSLVCLDSVRVLAFMLSYKLNFLVLANVVTFIVFILHIFYMNNVHNFHTSEVMNCGSVSIECVWKTPFRKSGHIYVYNLCTFIRTCVYLCILLFMYYSAYIVR